MKIKFYDVQFLYLTDKKYFKEYNEENNLSDEQINARIEELHANYYEVETGDVTTIKETDYQTLVSLLQDECAEYFGDFKYEIIEKEKLVCADCGSDELTYSGRLVYTTDNEEDFGDDIWFCQNCHEPSDFITEKEYEDLD